MPLEFCQETHSQQTPLEVAALSRSLITSSSTDRSSLRTIEIDETSIPEKLFEMGQHLPADIQEMAHKTKVDDWYKINDQIKLLATNLNDPNRNRHFSKIQETLTQIASAEHANTAVAEHCTRILVRLRYPFTPDNLENLQLDVKAIATAKNQELRTRYWINVDPIKNFSPREYKLAEDLSGQKPENFLEVKIGSYFKLNEYQRLNSVDEEYDEEDEIDDIDNYIDNTPEENCKAYRFHVNTIENVFIISSAYRSEDAYRGLTRESDYDQLIGEVKTHEKAMKILTLERNDPDNYHYELTLPCSEQVDYTYRHIKDRQKEENPHTIRRDDMTFLIYNIRNKKTKDVIEDLQIKVGKPQRFAQGTEAFERLKKTNLGKIFPLMLDQHSDFYHYGLDWIEVHASMAEGEIEYDLIEHAVPHTETDRK